MPGKVGQLAKVHGQFDPTYGPQPGDVAVIGQPLALTTGPFQVQVVFCGAAYDESIEILAPFMKPREFDGHLERSPSMQLSQARRYLVQAGTEARVIEKAGALYGAIEGHERRNPIFKVQIAEGPLQGKQLYCLGLCLQREPEGDALPWTFEEERTHTLAVLEEDNPEYVLAQYRSAYMMSRGKNLNFLAAKLQGHGLTPPNAEREAFQKSRRAGTEESIPKQTTTEATHNSKGSPPQNDDGTRDRPEKSALTLELLEDNGKHTKRGGLLPIYEVNAWVRNTSVQPPKHVAF